MNAPQVLENYVDMKIKIQKALENKKLRAQIIENYDDLREKQKQEKQGPNYVNIVVDNKNQEKNKPANQEHQLMMKKHEQELLMHSVNVRNTKIDKQERIRKLHMLGRWDRFRVNREHTIDLFIK